MTLIHGGLQYGLFTLRRLYYDGGKKVPAYLTATLKEDFLPRHQLVPKCLRISIILQYWASNEGSCSSQKYKSTKGYFFQKSPSTREAPRIMRWKESLRETFFEPQGGGSQIKMGKAWASWEAFCKAASRWSKKKGTQSRWLWWLVLSALDDIKLPRRGILTPDCLNELGARTGFVCGDCGVALIEMERSTPYGRHHSLGLGS